MNFVTLKLNDRLYSAYFNQNELTENSDAVLAVNRTVDQLKNLGVNVVVIPEIDIQILPESVFTTGSIPIVNVEIGDKSPNQFQKYMADIKEQLISQVPEFSQAVFIGQLNGRPIISLSYIENSINNVYIATVDSSNSKRPAAEVNALLDKVHDSLSTHFAGPVIVVPHGVEITTARLPY